MATLNEGKSTVGVNSGKLTIEQGNNRMLVNDGSDDRLLVGEEDSGDIVLKLSQSGYDVKTCTDAQLVMSSEFNMFKIVQSGTTSISKLANNPSGTSVITHNLGYIPVVIAYCDYTGGLFAGNASSGKGNPLPQMHQYQLVTAPAHGSYTVSVVDATLTVVSGTNTTTFALVTPSDTNGSTTYSTAYTCNIKYFILAETAS